MPVALAIGLPFMLRWWVMEKSILGLGLLVGWITVGCGSSDSAKPGLEGTWQAPISGNCVGVYKFTGTTFVDDLVCPLQNGNYGLEIESGTFSTTANKIDFMPQQSSCPPHSAGGYTVEYTVSGTQLGLLFPSASLLLERVSSTPAGMGGASLTGCWDMTTTPGTFTPGAIQAL